MSLNLSEFWHLRNRLISGDLQPQNVAEDALARANSNAGRNVYLALDGQGALARANALPQQFREGSARPLLYGIPVSLKDCFDFAGFPTTCGSRFYAERNGVATADSWVAARLRSQGAVIPGKTHLHQLAYGITGENSDYGDCAQPSNAAWLTGGSSSGAAASVQEGSAVAAIGTDTGGSIRVPAALCGLAGYRASVGLGDWSGGAHLADSFDTIGLLFRDLRDAPWFGRALFDLLETSWPAQRAVSIGVVHPEFLHDCDPDVLSSFEEFRHFVPADTMEVVDTSFWEEAFSIFSPIQAHEAAILHRGNFAHFEKPIRERLEWGASIPAGEILGFRLRHEGFRAKFDRLLRSFDFLIAPCAPVSTLPTGADHSAARARILRYTAPASLAGTPVVAVPFRRAGVQLIGRRGADGPLLAFAATLGEKLVGQ